MWMSTIRKSTIFFSSLIMDTRTSIDYHNMGHYASRILFFERLLPMQLCLCWKKVKTAEAAETAATSGLSKLTSHLDQIQKGITHYNDGSLERQCFALIAHQIANALPSTISSGYLEIQAFGQTIVFEETNDGFKATVNGVDCALDQDIQSLQALQKTIFEDMQTHVSSYKEIGIDARGIQFTAEKVKSNDIIELPLPPHGHVSDVQMTLIEEEGKENKQFYFSKPAIPSSEKVGAAVALSGIPENDDFSKRALFAYSMSQHLGMNVIPRTILIIDESNAVTGYALKKVDGMVAVKYLKNIGLSDLSATTIKGAIRLQLLDILVGQADHHGENIVINKKTGEVYCFDNDVCAGKNFTHPDDMVPGLKGGYEGFAGRGVSLPPVMDYELMNQFESLSEHHIIRHMTQLQFSAEEIEATCLRLQAIKSHIVDLKLAQSNGEHRIIYVDEKGKSPEEVVRLTEEKWKSPEILKQLTVDNNYLSRDRWIATAGKGT